MILRSTHNGYRFPGLLERASTPSFPIFEGTIVYSEWHCGIGRFQIMYRVVKMTLEGLRESDS